ncbi:hypothetical protein ACFE04_014910 [Oxalis oulophora]
MKHGTLTLEIFRLPCKIGVELNLGSFVNRSIKIRREFRPFSKRQTREETFLKFEGGFSVPLGVRPRNVFQLMETPVRQWNVHLINNIFKADVALAIKSIPLVQGDVKDQWVWNETNSGVYSVKSGYQIACKILYHSAPKSAPMVQFSKPLGSLKKSASYHLPEIGSIVETSGVKLSELAAAHQAWSNQSFTLKQGQFGKQFLWLSG